MGFEKDHAYRAWARKNMKDLERNAKFAPLRDREDLSADWKRLWTDKVAHVVAFWWRLEAGRFQVGALV